MAYKNGVVLPDRIPISTGDKLLSAYQELPVSAVVELLETVRNRVLRVGMSRLRRPRIVRHFRLFEREASREREDHRLPGCEIAKLQITVRGGSEARTIPCKPLGSLPLHGRMLHLPTSESSGIEVEANYLAPWDHQFFAMADGLVTSIRIGSAIPDEEGRFNLELPDLFRQAGLGKGSFQFLLRDSKSKNIIALLTPVNMDQYFDGLAIRTTYEPFVTFSLDTSVSTSPTKASRAIDQ